MPDQPAAAGHFWKYLTDGLLLVFIIGFVIWVFFRILQKSDDPGRLIFKWILTLAIAGPNTRNTRALLIDVTFHHAAI